MPCRIASAWALTPPPVTLAMTRNRPTVPDAAKGSRMVDCQGNQLKYSSMGLSLTMIAVPSSG